MLSQGISEDFEVLVVGIDKARLVPTHPKVRQIDPDTHYSTAQGTNIGINSASGEILVFLDSDCVPHPGWLEALLNGLKGVDLVVGSVSFPKVNYWHIGDNAAIFYNQHALRKPSDHFQGLVGAFNLAVRRTVFERVGLFDESEQLIGSQDGDWFYRYRRLGGVVKFHPEATVEHHHARSTLSDVIDHAKAYANRKVGNIRKHPFDPTLRRGIRPIRFLPASWTASGRSLWYVCRLLMTDNVIRHYWRITPVLWLFYTVWHMEVYRQLSLRPSFDRSGIPVFDTPLKSRN